MHLWIMMRDASTVSLETHIGMQSTRVYFVNSSALALSPWCGCDPPRLLQIVLSGPGRPGRYPVSHVWHVRGQSVHSRSLSLASQWGSSHSLSQSCQSVTVWPKQGSLLEQEL